MTGREQFLATLAGKQTDHVPFWELEFHLFDRYADRPLVLGKQFADLSAAQQEITLRENAETIVAVARKLGHSAVTTPGRYWEVSPGEPAYWWLPQEDHWRQLAALRKAAGNEIAVVRGVPGMICPPGGAGYEEFCYKLFDAPEEIDAQAAKTLQDGLEYARKARDLGADAVFNACDIADNHGVFFSPVQLERFWLPYLHKWAAAVTEMGLYTILHSDGNLTKVLDLLAASPLHALQAIDPIAGMDLAYVKQRVGHKLCLCGNVDCGVLHFGPAEKIRDLTERTISVGKPGGRFVLGASNAVFREMPVAHYDAMVSAWRRTR
jgi:uroporphyrinogen decarboxylase